MKAAYITGHGGNEVVQIGQREKPSAAPGQVVVRMRTRWASGKSKTAKPSGRFFSAQAASCGWLTCQSLSAALSSLWASIASLALKMPRIWRATGVRWSSRLT